MALATRIIPQILCSGRKLVKGQQYRSWRSVGVASQAVRIHQLRQVDELLLLDINATLEGRGPDLEMVRELADVCFSPLAVGGGVRSLQDIRDLLNNGADKVVIGTAACKDLAFVKEASKKYGCSTIVVSIDSCKGEAVTRSATTKCGISAYDAAIMAEQVGAGEVILNCVEREGTMEGYDLHLIEEVSRALSIPVVASCGCGSYLDMAKAIDAGASAVSAGAMFQFTDRTPRGAAEYLDAHGYEVRT